MLDSIMSILIQVAEILCIFVFPFGLAAYAVFAKIKKRQVLADEAEDQFLRPSTDLKTKETMLEERTWFNDTPEGRRLLAKKNQKLASESTESVVTSSNQTPLKTSMSPKVAEKDGQDGKTALERAVEEYAPRAATGTFRYNKRLKKYVPEEDVKVNVAKIAEIMNNEAGAENTPVVINIGDDALREMEKQAQEETLYMPRSSEEGEERGNTTKKKNVEEDG